MRAYRQLGPGKQAAMLHVSATYDPHMLGLEMSVDLGLNHYCLWLWSERLLLETIANHYRLRV